jgi:actin-related protein 8
MEENRLQASHMLQSSLQSNGDRRYATPPQQISAFNRNAVPQYKDTAPHSYAPEADIIYGEDVCHVTVLICSNSVSSPVIFQIFNIDPEKVYNIFFPISNGELNVNGQIGGSLTAVLGDLETIWTHCINKLLDIKTSEFHVSPIDFLTIACFCYHIEVKYYILKNIKNKLLLTNISIFFCVVELQSNPNHTRYF